MRALARRLLDLAFFWLRLQLLVCGVLTVLVVLTFVLSGGELHR